MLGRSNNMRQEICSQGLALAKGERLVEDFSVGMGYATSMDLPREDQQSERHWSNTGSREDQDPRMGDANGKGKRVSISTRGPEESELSPCGFRTGSVQDRRHSIVVSPLGAAAVKGQCYCSG